MQRPALRTSGSGSSRSAQPLDSGVGADAASGGIVIVDPIGPIPEDPPPPPPPPPAPEYDRTVTCYLVLNGEYLATMVQENSDPAQTYFLHTDMVGSIRAITNSAGQVVARFEYEPFGLLTMSTGSMAAGAHRFTGKPGGWRYATLLLRSEALRPRRQKIPIQGPNMLWVKLVLIL
ncbi:MAG: hypothetical protein VB144_05105 [Clostridia bacterium]|nr:hypothetical protein [Clostridia bacterium]